MADEPRTYSPSKVEATRARMQGLGAGQSDMDQQQDPSRERIATAADRPEPFDTEAGFSQSGDPPQTADFGEETTEAREPEPRSFDTAPEPHMVGTPANVDPHNLGEADNPELDWGESEPGAVHGATNTRRPIKTEAERGQGPKTRSRNKQIVSGRPYD
jgi:hypothetical protein